MAAPTPINETFKLVFPDLASAPAKKKREAFAEMIYFDPKLALTLKTFLTTGTETGKSAARDLLEEDINFATFAKGSNQYKSVGTAVFLSSAGTQLQEKIARFWSVGNVIEELGSSFTPQAVAEAAGQTHHAIFKGIESEQTSVQRDKRFDPKHWRGVAVLTLCVNLEVPKKDHEEFHRHGSEFVQWVSDREDLDDIIELVVSRSIFNPVMLESLLESKGSVHGSINQGIL